jgi:hypothetical protein
MFLNKICDNFRNFLPFISVLVSTGMKTGSFRASTKSIETKSSVKIFSSKLTNYDFLW